VIVTGAPIEHLPFDQVMYWGELRDFLDEVSSGFRRELRVEGCRGTSLLRPPPLVGPYSRTLPGGDW